MHVLKIRQGQVLRRISLSTLNWETFCKAIQECCSIASVSKVRVVCEKPVPDLEIESEAQLSTLVPYKVIVVSVRPKPPKDSFFSQVLRELLSIESNKHLVKTKFKEVLVQFPSITLETLVPEESLRNPLREVYEEAFAQANRPSNPFRLMYVLDNGKQSLVAKPNTEWIDYSTTSLDNLAKSLPPQVISKLQNNPS